MIGGWNGVGLGKEVKDLFWGWEGLGKEIGV